MKQSEGNSITLSIICTAAFAVMLAAADICGVWIARLAVGISALMTASDIPLLLASLYTASVPAWAALAKLYGLLRCAKEGGIFTARAVSMMRSVSYCCFAVGAVCLVSCLYYPVFFIPAAAAVFMGLIVRVVKNCFESAVAMKDELDLTV